MPSESLPHLGPHPPRAWRCPTLLSDPGQQPEAVLLVLALCPTLGPDQRADGAQGRAWSCHPVSCGRPCTSPTEPRAPPQEAWLLNRERELREEVRRDRDKEIELVIHRLEADMTHAREESERAAESR